jgi:hypothetical protein
MVEYFEMPEIPGRKYFRCDKLRATLSVDACAIQWRKANHHNDENCSRCKCCSLGAVHAGETAASMSPLKGTLTCARCHKRSTRLIGKHLCVSCANRQYEVLKGRNAKGTKPVKLAPLHPRTIHFHHGSVRRSLSLPLSVDTDELIVSALRDSINTVTFFFRANLTGLPIQLRLW